MDFFINVAAPAPSLSLYSTVHPEFSVEPPPPLDLIQPLAAAYVSCGNNVDIDKTLFLPQLPSQFIPELPSLPLLPLLEPHLTPLLCPLPPPPRPPLLAIPRAPSEAASKARDMLRLLSVEPLLVSLPLVEPASQHVRLVRPVISHTKPRLRLHKASITVRVSTELPATLITSHLSPVPVPAPPLSALVGCCSLRPLQPARRSAQRRLVMRRVLVLCDCTPPDVATAFVDETAQSLAAAAAAAGMRRLALPGGLRKHRTSRLVRIPSCGAGRWAETTITLVRTVQVRPDPVVTPPALPALPTLHSAAMGSEGVGAWTEACQPRQQGRLACTQWETQAWSEPLEEESVGEEHTQLALNTPPPVPVSPTTPTPVSLPCPVTTPSPAETPGGYTHCTTPTSTPTPAQTPASMLTTMATMATMTISPTFTVVNTSAPAVSPLPLPTAPAPATTTTIYVPVDLDCRALVAALADVAGTDPACPSSAAELMAAPAPAPTDPPEVAAAKMLLQAVLADRSQLPALRAQLAGTEAADDLADDYDRLPPRHPPLELAHQISRTTGRALALPTSQPEDTEGQLKVTYDPVVQILACGQVVRVDGDLSGDVVVVGIANSALARPIDHLPLWQAPVEHDLPPAPPSPAPPAAPLSIAWSQCFTSTPAPAPSSLIVTDPALAAALRARGAHPIMRPPSPWAAEISDDHLVVIVDAGTCDPATACTVVSLPASLVTALLLGAGARAAALAGVLIGTGASVVCVSDMDEAAAAVLELMPGDDRSWMEERLTAHELFFVTAGLGGYHAAQVVLAPVENAATALAGNCGPFASDRWKEALKHMLQ